MTCRARAIAPEMTPAPTRIQRKCACGAKSSDGGSCPSCAEEKLKRKIAIGPVNDPLEREADRIADDVMRGRAGSITTGTGLAAATTRRSRQSATQSAERSAPAIVHQVLERPGRPLETSARHFFERRFNRDFGTVRIHADAEAATAARAVNAHAYTVGNHVVFGEGRYAPANHAGRRLLAHELTHVVQQGSALRRDSISPPITGSGPTDEEEEKDEDGQAVQRMQRHVAIVGSDEAGPNADLTGEEEAREYRLAEREKKLAECKKANPDPEVCDPETPPDWSSFTSTAPANARFGAATFSSIKALNVPSTKCEQDILGFSSGQARRFQGVLDPAKSSVKDEFRNATDPTKNGVAAIITECESKFQPGLEGGWFRLSANPPGCPASIQPRRDRATKKSECTTLVAKDFNDRAAAESARLLKHEQTHLALTCAMAKKGNDALNAGKTFAQVDAVIHSKLSTTQGQYDGQTNHGCNAAPQATWETNIANDLPAVRLFR
jgi:hypothetical protein